MDVKVVAAAGLALLASEHLQLRLARLQALGGMDQAEIDELRTGLAVVRAELTLEMAEHLDAFGAVLYSTLPPQGA